MKKYIKEYQKKYGYKPSNFEIISLHRQGQILITSKEENEILKLIEKLNLN